MPNRRRMLLAIATGLAACAGDGPSGTDPTVGSAPPILDLPDDRSLAVSYAAGTIAVSFDPENQPRAMWARVFTHVDDGWVYFGYLTTENANTPGSLTTAPEDVVAVLGGVNFQAAPDRYTAPDLTAGEYLVCAELVDTDPAVEVCGDFAVPSAGAGGITTTMRTELTIELVVEASTGLR